MLTLSIRWTTLLLNTSALIFMESTLALARRVSLWCVSWSRIPNLVSWNLQTLSKCPLYLLPVFIRKKKRKKILPLCLAFWFVRITLKIYTLCLLLPLHPSRKIKHVSTGNFPDSAQNPHDGPCVLRKVFLLLMSNQQSLVSRLLRGCH